MMRGVTSWIQNPNQLLRWSIVVLNLLNVKKELHTSTDEQASAAHKIQNDDTLIPYIQNPIPLLRW